MKQVLRILLVLLVAAPLAHAQAPRVGAGWGYVATASAMPALAAADVAPMALSVYPNPLVDDATVRFTLERPQRVTLDVFDLLGRRVRGHDLGRLAAGEHETALSLRGLPPGLYIVRLTGDAGAQATVRVTRLPSA
jgi:hypothetical protein